MRRRAGITQRRCLSQEELRLRNAVRERSAWFVIDVLDGKQTTPENYRS